MVPIVVLLLAAFSCLAWLLCLLLARQGVRTRAHALEALSAAKGRRDAAAAAVMGRVQTPLADALSMVIAEMACERTAASCLIALASGALDDWPGVEVGLVHARGGPPAAWDAFEVAVGASLRCAALEVVARHAADPSHPQRLDAERVLRAPDRHPAAKVVHVLTQIRRSRAAVAWGEVPGTVPSAMSFATA